MGTAAPWQPKTNSFGGHDWGQGYVPRTHSSGQSPVEARRALTALQCNAPKPPTRPACLRFEGDAKPPRKTRTCTAPTTATGQDFPLLAGLTGPQLPQPRQGGAAQCHSGRGQHLRVPRTEWTVGLVPCPMLPVPHRIFAGRVRPLSPAPGVQASAGLQDGAPPAIQRMWRVPRTSSRPSHSWTAVQTAGGSPARRALQSRWFGVSIRAFGSAKSRKGHCVPDGPPRAPSPYSAGA